MQFQINISQAHPRNIDLDIVKGVLVLIMLTYHCASVAILVNFLPAAKSITDRVSFIHYAFILISGYLCGWYYWPRFGSPDSDVRRRLFIRALKTTGIFFFLNLILYSMGIVYSFDQLLARINSLNGIVNFLNGPPGNLAAFEVLYYIALFLFLSSVVLGRRTILSLILGSILFLIYNNSGLPYWMLFGFVGMMVGILVHKGYLEDIWIFLEKTKGIPVIAGLVAYQFYLPRIHSVVNEFDSHYLNVVTYLTETVLWFLSFIFFVRLLNINSLRSAVAAIGKYTLLGYIAQMPIIRMGYGLLKKAGFQGFSYYLTNLIISGIVLCFFILVFSYLRSRVSILDRCYKSVFQ